MCNFSAKFTDDCVVRARDSRRNVSFDVSPVNSCYPDPDPEPQSMKTSQPDSIKPSMLFSYIVGSLYV